MRDIVTDLRTLAAMPEYDRAADMFEKCADEIERLRAALSGLVGAVADHTSQKSIPDGLREARAALATQPAKEDRA